MNFTAWLETTDPAFLEALGGWRRLAALGAAAGGLMGQPAALPATEPAAAFAGKPEFSQFAFAPDYSSIEIEIKYPKLPGVTGQQYTRQAGMDAQHEADRQLLNKTRRNDIRADYSPQYEIVPGKHDVTVRIYVRVRYSNKKVPVAPEQIADMVKANTKLVLPAGGGRISH